MEKKKFLIDEYLQGRPDVRFFKHIVFRFSLYFKERETWKLWNNSESIFEKDQGITIK